MMSEERVIRTRLRVSLEPTKIMEDENGLTNQNAIKVEPLDENLEDHSELNQFCFENEEFKIKTERSRIKTEILDENSNDEEIPDLLLASDNGNEIKPQNAQNKIPNSLQMTANMEADVFECRFKCGMNFSKKSKRHVHETLTRHFHCDYLSMQKTCLPLKIALKPP